jgi:flavin-dependent dehydrogenase
VSADDGPHRARFVVGAGGVSGPVGRSLAGRVPLSSLSLCAGYYVHPPGGNIVVGFLRRRACYAWMFPGPSAASVGVVSPLGAADGKELLNVLRAWLDGAFPGLRFDLTRPFFALVPEYRSRRSPVCGPGWALVGDEAGVADPVTREGIFFSLLSSEALACALREGDEASYGRRFTTLMASAHRRALAARRLFFRPPLPGLLVRAARRSPRSRELLGGFFSGDLAYDAGFLRALLA